MPYKDPEKAKERKKAYYLANQEKIRDKAREYWRANRANYAITDKAYYEKNKSKVIARTLAYEKAHPEQRKETVKRYWYNKRMRVFTALGGASCRGCGFSDWRALQIDHINGGGKKHIESFTSTATYHRYVHDNPTEFQVLCANCNSIKRHTNKENNWRDKDGNKKI
jgi:hypothetical protein